MDSVTIAVRSLCLFSYLEGNNVPILTKYRCSSTYLSIYLSICLSIYLSIYLWLYSPCGPWPLFQFLNLDTVIRTRWTGDQPIVSPLLTHRTTHTQNESTQIFTPRVGFELTIPVFEPAKMVHALDRAATVISKSANTCESIHSDGRKIHLVTAGNR
jgi:hypothetical protein